MEQQPYFRDSLETMPYSPELAQTYLNKVYLMMAGCLFVTAAVAGYTMQSVETLIWVAGHTWMLALATLGIVLAMSLGANTFTKSALTGLLFVFAGVQGLLFGPLVMLYTQQSLALTFGITAGMFGGMSLYGYFTKSDLSVWRRGLIMGLIGLIIAGIINIFWGNGTADLIISCIGVLIFAGFTAYDTQRLLQEGLCGDEERRAKGAVLGALTLYLDFINLFLYLLRLFGSRRD